MLLRTIKVPERSVHVVGDSAPVLHASRVGRLHAVLVGAEPPVAARLEEVGVVGGVVAPAQGRLDPRHRQTQSPDGLRPSDLPLGVKHPVVLTYAEKQKSVGWYGPCGVLAILNEQNKMADTDAWQTHFIRRSGRGLVCMYESVAV